MKHLKKYENYEEDYGPEVEYIFKTSSQWIGTEHEEPLYDFTDADYEDYKKGGPTYTEYEDKAVDYHGLEWELSEDGETLHTSTQWGGTEQETDSEGYTEDDYDSLRDIAIQDQGIEFEIVPTEMKKQSKKYNL